MRDQENDGKREYEGTPSSLSLSFSMKKEQQLIVIEEKRENRDSYIETEFDSSCFFKLSITLL